MKLKGRKIGVAITGSFCTYEKVFQALRALKKEEAELQTIFSDAAQSIDSRFGKCRGFCDKGKGNHRGRADADNPPGGAYRTERPFGSADFNAVYGKQHCEAGQWDYGHSCADGCKSASAQ